MAPRHIGDVLEEFGQLQGLDQVAVNSRRGENLSRSLEYPNGLPTPLSDDPTPWIFSGHPRASTNALQIAVARLLGYCWPRQTGSSFPDCSALDLDGLETYADADGIVCLAPLAREESATERLPVAPEGGLRRGIQCGGTSEGQELRNARRLAPR